MVFSKEELQKLKEAYTAYLFDDFLPFMDTYVVDHDHGGFMCNADWSGRRLSDQKRAWYDGRGIWVYSYLYKNFGRNNAHLEIAKKTVDLVLNLEPKSNKFWPWGYSRRGEMVADQEPDIYGSLFVAEGLAMYASATGKMEYWDKAKSIALDCLTAYDRGDYNYVPHYQSSASLVKAPRVLGHWMVFLRLTTQMLNVKNDSDLLELSDRCIVALLEEHLNPDFNLLNEYLGHDFERPNDEISQFVYIGHGIEVLWMIMDEAVRRNDDSLFDRASQLFKRHVEVAWDDVFGGVFHNLENVEKYQWELDKVLWAQEEVLIGTMMLITERNDPWAVHWFSKMYDYVIDHFSLKPHGYDLWNIGSDRKMTFIDNGERIENYHHPRHLMLNIERLHTILSNF